MSLALVAIMAFAAYGQDAVKLEWKFEKGKTFYQEMTTKTKQTMKIMAMDNITQNHDQTFIFSWTPVDQDNDKNWIVSQKIDGVKMDIDIGGNKITYDATSSTPHAGNPLAGF